MTSPDRISLPSWMARDSENSSFEAGPGEVAYVREDLYLALQKYTSGPTEPIDREKFEDMVFKKHFFAHVKFDPKKQLADCSGQKSKAELCARDIKGNYIDEAISAMWFGWQSCADLMPKFHPIISVNSITPDGLGWTSPKYRSELLNLATQCGAVLTGKPDGSESITIIFTVDAWRAFDVATRPAADKPTLFKWAAEVDGSCGKENGPGSEWLSEFADKILTSGSGPLDELHPWKTMVTAPKDGTVILALLEGSDVAHPIVWRDPANIKDAVLTDKVGWHMSWDSYYLEQQDAPRYWMHISDDPDDKHDFGAVHFTGHNMLDGRTS